jgi:hypothetical protein
MALLEDLLGEYDPPLTGDSNVDAQTKRFEGYIEDAESKASSITPPLSEPIKTEAILAWSNHRIFKRAYSYLLSLPERTAVEMAGSTDQGDIAKRLGFLKGERDRALNLYKELTNPPETTTATERRESGYLPVKFHF